MRCCGHLPFASFQRQDFASFISAAFPRDSATVSHVLPKLPLGSRDANVSAFPLAGRGVSCLETKLNRIQCERGCLRPVEPGPGERNILLACRMAARSLAQRLAASCEVCKHVESRRHRGRSSFVPGHAARSTALVNQVVGWRSSRIPAERQSIGLYALLPDSICIRAYLVGGSHRRRHAVFRERTQMRLRFIRLRQPIPGN